MGVVMAAGGYPNSYRKGDEISFIPEETPTLKVFHAGTKEKDSVLTTNGGRVLCVTALGENTTQAKIKAYNSVNQITWQDCYYRTDIGFRAVGRES